MRKFSIPYNNSNPIDYLEAIKPYKENIDSIYFGIASMFPSHLPNTDNWQVCLEKQVNTDRFLALSKGKYKRILAYNNAHDFSSDGTKILTVMNHLAPYVTSREIDAIIVSDLALARVIHEILPNLEIQTSCNTYCFTVQQIKYWIDYTGCKVVNPPREAVRIPKLLKEIHELGIKTKYIVNESCLFGCPQLYNHCAYIATNMQGYAKFCELSNDDTRILKSNFVLPRWLSKLDPYVDIYKIAGRKYPTSAIIRMLDAYINESDDTTLNDIIAQRMIRGYYRNKILPVKHIPDKLLSCQCKQCNTCNECKNYIRDYMITVPLGLGQ